MELTNAKGTRDIPAQEKIARDNVTKTLISTFERYGFSPLETPIIEKLDILAAKYAGGETSDVMKEVFKLQDQGERSLGLRFDLTVPLARYIGMNPTLKMPYKRYQIGLVFRDGPLKKGRYRQFWQYDVDIIGSKTASCDAELIRMAKAVFDDLEIDVKIKINNRKFLTEYLTTEGIKTTEIETAITSIDKLDKIGVKGVVEELTGKGINLSIESIQKLSEFTLTNLPKSQGAQELQELFALLPQENIVFSPTLARGLSYYTGTVIEIYSIGTDINVAIAGGGRYDNLIGSYLEGKMNVAAVGLSFGFEPIMDILSKKIAQRNSVTQIYIIPIGDVLPQAMRITDALRAQGINTDIDFQVRGVSKAIRYADSYTIPYVLFVGEDEIKSQQYKIRDLKTGEEKTCPLSDIIATFKK